MSKSKSDSEVVNPKAEGQKHTENTSEISKPHTSEDHPEEHVDSMAFGKDGQRDPDHDVDGLTDKGLIDMGKETYENHQANKTEK
jgi:hypothetical protein